MNIFLSYAREDREVVAATYNLLKMAGHNPWVDTRQLQVGQIFDVEIEQAISSGLDVLLVFISENALNSAYVNKECRMAYDQGVKIAPVILESGLLEDAYYKRSSWEFIKDVQWFDFTSWRSHLKYTELVADLIDELSGDMGQPSLSQQPNQLIEPSHTEKDAHLKIFMNYRESGYSNKLYSDELLAGQLTASLKEFGADIPFATVEVKVGEEWGERVQSELNQCDLMLMIVSRTSLRSRRVDSAWREFLYQQKNVILLVNDDMTNSDNVFANSRLFHSEWAMAGDPLHYINFYRELTSNELNNMEKRDQLGKAQYEQGLKHLCHVIEKMFSGRLNLPNGFCKPVENRFELKSKLDPGALALTHPIILQSQDRFVGIEKMIQRAQNEILVCGVTLQKVVNATDSLRTFLREKNGRLKLIMVNPESDLDDVAEYLGRNKGELRQTVNLSKIRLEGLWSQFPTQVEVYLFNNRPSVGYFIVDPDLAHAEMTVAPYLYKMDAEKNIDVSKPPFVYLIKRNVGKWFGVYKADFDRIMNGSSKWANERSEEI